MKESWEYYRKEVGTMSKARLESLHVMFYSGALAALAQIIEDAENDQDLKAALDRAVRDVYQTLERITRP